VGEKIKATKTSFAQSAAVLSALLFMGFFIPASAGAEDDSFAGRVTAVDGVATAQQPGQEPRVLQCGDAVYDADRLVTEDGAQLGVLLGDVLAHIPGDSTLLLDRTAERTPDVRLERGAVRLIDPRDGGALGYLSALDARAEFAGTDVEGYLFAEKVGPYAMLCEWDEPLAVARGDEREVAEPGNCVIAKKTEPIYVAQAHDERIPVLADQLCEIDPGALAALAGDPTRHLTPADVAAPGPMAGTGTAGFGSSNPMAAGLPERSPCDVPGSGCNSGFSVLADGPPPVPFP
jgi:hypothetical protein